MISYRNDIKLRCMTRQDIIGIRLIIPYVYLFRAIYFVPSIPYCLEDKDLIMEFADGIWYGVL